jgi:hypothetical protein
MEELPLILLILACPLGCVLMGAVMWIAGKGSGLFGRKDSETRDPDAEVHSHS